MLMGRMEGSAEEMALHNRFGVVPTLAAGVRDLMPFFKDPHRPGWAPNVRMLDSPAWFEGYGSPNWNFHPYEVVSVRLAGSLARWP